MLISLVSATFIQSLCEPGKDETFRCTFFFISLSFSLASWAKLKERIEADSCNFARNICADLCPLKVEGELVFSAWLRQPMQTFNVHKGPDVLPPPRNQLQMPSPEFTCDRNKLSSALLLFLSSTFVLIKLDWHSFEAIEPEDTHTHTHTHTRRWKRNFSSERSSTKDKGCRAVLFHAR